MGMTIKLRNNALIGDFWGGLASMLVALPSAIAFGVTIYAAIGPEYAGLGALAGILGTTALGLIAPTLGGTNRLITAPCAPAAAVCSAFAIELVQSGVPAAFIVLMLTALGLVCGIVQLLLGFVGVGGLIKYIPFPVVSGYLSGVGLIIIGSQIPKFLGVMDGTSWLKVLIAPELWQWQSALIGATTIAVMLAAPRFTRLVPAAILGLLAGVITYFAIAYAVDDSLLVLDGNPLIIGSLGGTASSMLEAITGRWQEIGELKLSQIGGLLGTAFTLGVLLSIDTLKTCVVLDTLTRSRHDSNRELIAQGSGNIASACVGGMPGAGQMGATLVNLTSGGQTRVSGVIEGVLSLITFLALGTLIAWIPVASLAGILIIVGVRMIDWQSLHLLESPWTRFDFFVVATVVVVALGYSLIAASGVGIVLAMFLFIREQLSSTVIRSKVDGGSRFSKRVRLRQDMEVLEKEGSQMAILELQGSLFFGTKDQLYLALEPELATRKFLVLDMRRVQSVDVTAVHLLEQIRDSLSERDAFLVFSNVSRTLPNGRNIGELFEQMALTTTEHVKIFPELDDAVEWVEDQILGKNLEQEADVAPLELADLEIFSDHKEETLVDLEASFERRSVAKDGKVYSFGDPGNELFLIRKGAVRITLPGSGRLPGHHALTHGRGDFFGGMAFLSQQTRFNDATAVEDTELYVLQRSQMEKFREEHKRLAFELVEAVAKVLATRLRYSDKELMAMQD